MDVTIEEKIGILKKIDFFAALSQQELSRIAELMQWVEYPSGTEFINEGEESSAVYFIVSGAVRVFRTTEDGNIVNIAVLPANNIVGEMALIDDEPRSASVVTIMDTSMFLIYSSSFKELLKNHNGIALNLIKALSHRIRENNDLTVDKASVSLATRTWIILKNLAGLFPNKEINLSQEDIAVIVGASRPRITEALQSLEKEEKILLSHKNIKIR